MKRKAVFVLFTFLSAFFSLNGQTTGTLGTWDRRINNPGVRGRITVSDLSAQGVMREQGLVVVTNMEVTKVLGESVIDHSGLYSISNLPTGQELLVHYLFRSWCIQTEKIKVSNWVEKNIRVNIHNYNANFLDDQLVSNLSLVLIGLHYSTIILKGQSLKKKAELIDLIHYIRLQGNWQITGEKRGNEPMTTVSPGRNIELYDDLTGKGPNGSPFSWRIRWEKTREKTVRHWDKYEIVLLKANDEHFINTSQWITNISYENLKYKGIFFDKRKNVYFFVEKPPYVNSFSDLSQISSGKQKSLQGSFSFRINPNEKQVVSRTIDDHPIELVFDPVEKFEVNLYFDGIYYSLYNVQSGMGNNSTFLWEPGAQLSFNENSGYFNSIPIFFDLDIKQASGQDLLVNLKLVNNPNYPFAFDIREYLGEYYAPHSGEGFTFFMRGGELFVRSTMRDSPYFMGGKLENAGYRTLTREWTSAMGISSVAFTFNTLSGGFIVVNVIGDLVDYPSQGYFLYKK